VHSTLKKQIAVTRKGILVKYTHILLHYLAWKQNQWHYKKYWQENSLPEVLT
jgi:hypothetical protein